MVEIAEPCKDIEKIVLLEVVRTHIERLIEETSGEDISY
jgi:hypothetical protein